MPRPKRFRWYAVVSAPLMELARLSGRSPLTRSPVRSLLAQIEAKVSSLQERIQKMTGLSREVLLKNLEGGAFLPPGSHSRRPSARSEARPIHDLFTPMDVMGRVRGLTLTQVLRLR